MVWRHRDLWTNFLNYKASNLSGDEEKYAVNLRKHRIRFEEAAEVFFDPEQQLGDASVEEEDREFIVGFSFNYNLLYTVYVERGERTRIISARKADERR